MMQRKSLVRIDNVQRRNRVEAARNAIYVNNYAIDGTVVQNLLMEDSLVPTTVSILQSFCTI